MTISSVLTFRILVKQRFRPLQVCRDESRICKADKMNPDYILREQGAVLNWFDITEIDGRFSLNDKIGDITRSYIFCLLKNGTTEQEALRLWKRETVLMRSVFFTNSTQGSFPQSSPA